MTNFQEKLSYYQQEIKRISDSKEGNEWILGFKEPDDLDALLQEFGKYDTKQRIGWQNILHIIENEDFIKKLSPTAKGKIIEELKGQLDYDKWSKDLTIFERLLWVFLIKYSPDDIKRTKKLYEFLKPKKFSLDDFSDYFRVKNQKNLFWDTFQERLFGFNEEDVTKAILVLFHQEDIEYFCKNLDILELLFDVVLKDNKLIVQFFKSFSDRSYLYGRDKKRHIQKAFLDTISKLPQKSAVLSKFRDMFLKLLSLENEYLGGYSHYDLQEILKDGFTFAVGKELSLKYANLLIEISYIIKKWSWISYDSGIAYVIAHIITKDKIASLVDNLKDLRDVLLHIYDRIKEIDKGGDKKQLLKEFEKYIGEELKQRKIIIEERKKEILQRELKEKIEFRKQIEKAKETIKDKERISEWLIYNYANAKNKFLPKDNIFIKKQVIRFFASKKYYLPETGNLKITKQEGGSTSYTAPGYIVNGTFENCLQIAKDLKINVVPYRNKIIAFLPFAYDKGIQLVFDLIPNLTKENVEYLLNIYSKTRDDIDDLRKNHPYDFIKAYKHYKKDFNKFKINGILKDMLLLPDTRFGSDILDILAERGEENDFFKKTFTENLPEDFNYFRDVLVNEKGIPKQQIDTYKLAVKANEILIEQKDPEAIRRRIQQLQKTEVQYTRPGAGETHFVTGIMEEIDYDREFVKILKIVKQPRFFDDFIGVLNHSFDLVRKEKNEEYKSLYRYLRDIVGTYINNIEPKFRKHALAETKTICDKYEKESYWFRAKYLNDLETKKKDIGTKTILKAKEDKTKCGECQKKGIKISELNNRVIYLQTKNNELEENIESYKDLEQNQYIHNILLVEDEETKKYIEKAWELFGKKQKLKIVPCNGYDLIEKIINNESDGKITSTKILGLFDFDKGFNKRNGLKRGNEPIITDPKEGLLKKDVSSNVYALMLPIPGDHLLKHQVIKTTQDTETEIENTYMTFGEYSEFEIESYLYNEETAKDKTIFIEKEKYPGGRKVIVPKKDKKEFMNDIRKKLNLQNEMEYFKYFKSLIDIIENIFNGEFSKEE